MARLRDGWGSAAGARARGCWKGAEAGTHAVTGCRRWAWAHLVAGRGRGCSARAWKLGVDPGCGRGSLAREWKLGASRRTMGAGMTAGRQRGGWERRGICCPGTTTRTAGLSVSRDYTSSAGHHITQLLVQRGSPSRATTHLARVTVSRDYSSSTALSCLSQRQRPTSPGCSLPA